MVGIALGGERHEAHFRTFVRGTETVTDVPMSRMMLAVTDEKRRWEPAPWVRPFLDALEKTRPCGSRTHGARGRYNEVARESDETSATHGAGPHIA